jgi:hypothetical protein
MYVWRIRKFLPDRYGQPCKLVTLRNGKKAYKGKVIVEFADGNLYRTSINFIRKRKE